MRDVLISEDALEDLNNGSLFYEAQESGLGSTARSASTASNRREATALAEELAELARCPTRVQFSTNSAAQPNRIQWTPRLRSCFISCIVVGAPLMRGVR
jgi:hypothetical protein